MFDASERKKEIIHTLAAVIFAIFQFANGLRVCFPRRSFNVHIYVLYRCRGRGCLKRFIPLYIHTLD